LLGLLKLFSLVSLFHQKKFEKELEESLKNELKDVPDSDLQKPLNPSSKENSLNNSLII
jgi:hypothetical protein